MSEEKKKRIIQKLILILMIVIGLSFIASQQLKAVGYRLKPIFSSKTISTLQVAINDGIMSNFITGGTGVDPRVIDGKVVDSPDRAEIFYEFDEFIKPKLNHMEHPTWLLGDFDFSLWCNQHGADVNGYLTAPEQHYWAWVDKTDGGPTAYNKFNPYYWYRRAPGKGMIYRYYETQYVPWYNKVYSNYCCGAYADPYKGDHGNHVIDPLATNLSDAMPKKHNPLMSIEWRRKGTYPVDTTQDGIFVFTQQKIYKDVDDLPYGNDPLSDEQKSKGWFNADEKQAAIWELKPKFNADGRDNDKDDRNLGFIAKNYQNFYDKIHENIPEGEEDSYYRNYIDAMYVDENGNIQPRDDNHVTEIEEVKLKDQSEAYRTFRYDDSYIQITPEEQTWILGPYVIDYSVDDEHLDAYDIKGTGKSTNYEEEEDPWNGQPSPTPDPNDPLGPEPTLPPDDEPSSEIVYDQVRFNAVQKITVYNQNQDDIITLGGNFKIAYKCFEGVVSEEALEKRVCDYEPYWQKEMGELYDDERYWYDGSGAGYYIIADGKEVPAFLSRKPFYIVVERGEMDPDEFTGFYAKIDIQYLEHVEGEITDYEGVVMFYYYDVQQMTEGFFYEGWHYEPTGEDPHTHKFVDLSKTMFTDTYIFELQREESSKRAQKHISWNHKEGTYDRIYKRRSIIITSFMEPPGDEPEENPPPEILLRKVCDKCEYLYGAEFFIELHITGHDFKFNEDIDKTIRFYRITDMAGSIVITADEIADYGIYLQWLENATIEAHVEEIKAPGGHMISIPAQDFSVTLDRGKLNGSSNQGENVWFLGEWKNDHSETPEIILEKMIDGQDGLAESVEAFFDIHVAYTKPGGELDKNGKYLINTGELVDNKDNIIRGKTYEGLLKLTAEDFASLRDPLELNGYTGIITLDITEIRTDAGVINPRGVDITLVYYNGKLLNYSRYTNAEVIAHYAYDNPMATIYNYVKGIITGDDTAIADKETVEFVEKWAKGQMDANKDMKFIDVLGWLAKHIEENYINEDGTFNQINEVKASTMTVIDEDGKVRIIFENDAGGDPELPEITPTPTPTPNPYLMDIAGYAFLDERTTKDEEKESNGKFDLGEMLLSGIEVTLYEEGGEKAELIPNDDGSINHNPTVTDEQGRYIFRNVDPMKTYYVEFKYNGVEYETTKQGAPAEYNSEEWMTSAKAVQEGEPNVDTKVIDKRDKAYNYEELSTLYAEISALALKHIRTNTTEQLDMEKIRQQVEGMHQDGVEEGNPKQDPEIKKKMQFIRDAEVKAYAGYSNLGKGKSETYPHESIRKTFINNIHPINPGYTKVENAKDPNVPLLYPGQRQVHLGLVTKPGIKLSLHSDIVDTTVSMNNYDTTYDYFKGESNYHQYMFEEDYHYKKANGGEEGEHITEDGIACYTEDKIHFYITYDIQVTSHSTLQTNIDKIVNYHNKHLQFNSQGYTTTKGTKIDAITSYTGTEPPEKLTNELGVSAEPISGLDGLKDVEDRYKALLITIGDNQIEEGEANAKHVRITFEMIKDDDANSEKEKKNAEAILDEKLWQDKRNPEEDVMNMVMRSWILGNYSEIYQYSTEEGYLDRESRPQNFIIKDFEEANKKFQKAFIEYILSGGAGDEHEQRRWYNRMEQIRESDAWYVGITLTNNIYTRILEGNVWEAINWSEDSDKRIVSSLDLNIDASGGAGKDKYATYLEAENLKDREGNAIDKSKLNLEGIKVELVELVKDRPVISDKEYDSSVYDHKESEGCTQIVRAVTKTDTEGKYKFESYIAGDYTVRFIYGGEDTEIDGKPIESKVSTNTFTTEEPDFEEEYPDYLTINGQYYQSTKANPNTNTTRYWYKDKDYEERGSEEKEVENEDLLTRYSDAYDDAYSRRSQMLSDIKEQGDGIKIEDEKSRKAIDKDPLSPSEPGTKAPTSSDFNYQGNISVEGAWHDDPIYAYTSTMELEIEYIRPEIAGNRENEWYSYEIKDVDFGVTPRAYNDVDIKQYISNIKLFNQDKNGAEEKIEADVDFNEEGKRIDENGNEMSATEAEGIYGKLVHDLIDDIKQNTLQDGKYLIEYEQEMLQNLRVEFTYSIIVRNKSLYEKTNENENEEDDDDEGVYDKIKYIYKMGGSELEVIAVIYYQEDGSTTTEQGGNLEPLVFYENDKKDNGEEVLREDTIVYHNNIKDGEQYYSKECLSGENRMKSYKSSEGNDKRTDNFVEIKNAKIDETSKIITSQVEKIIDFVNEPLQFRRPEDEKTGEILQNKNWMKVGSEDFISSRENYSIMHDDEDKDVQLEIDAGLPKETMKIDGEILYDTDQESNSEKTKLITANSDSIMYTRKDDGLSAEQRQKDKTNLYAAIKPGKMRKDEIVLGYNLSTSVTDSNKYEYPNQVEITELRNMAGKIVDIEGYEMNRKETSKVRHLRDIQYGETLEGPGNLGTNFDKNNPVATEPKDYRTNRLEGVRDKDRTMRYTPTISLSRAGTVQVTVPTGVDEKTNTVAIILGVTFVGLVIFAVGIVLIKKFVILPRKE